MQAYYSAKMAELTGTVIWEGEDGREVECTSVSEGAHSLAWDDVQELGSVTRWVRQGALPERGNRAFA
jgi:hypothetical protein